MTGWVRNGVSVLLGVGAAIATTAAMNGFGSLTDEHADRSSPSPAVAAQVDGSPLSSARLPRLQGSPRLEAEPTRDPEPGKALEQPENSPPEAEAEEQSHEGASARLAAKFAGYASLHQSDPVDPAWAPEAEGHLKHALEAWGQGTDASVAEAECKTEVCRAKVEWQDYATAQRHGLELAGLEIPGLNCAQRIWLREPEDPTRAYSAYLYLDCAQLRLGMLDAEP